MTSKKHLSERGICTKYINPALVRSGWNIKSQIREEVSFTDGRIIVQGKMHTRGKRKRADYILYYKPNLPIAIIEAKDNKHAVGEGMQQALEYAEILQIPFVFSSNGDGFVFHDKTISEGEIEKELSLDEFPTPDFLWKAYLKDKKIETEEAASIVQQSYPMDMEVGVSREGLSMTKLKLFLFHALLPEKKAIVETVNRLMTLCDQLEQEVQQSERQVELVMMGVLREVLGV